MRLFIPLFIFLLLSICSCRELTENEKLPYEREKVLEILGDVHFAKVSSNLYKEEERDSVRSIFMNQLFEIHDINESDYNNLMNILESDLILYFQIEKEVHTYVKKVQKQRQKRSKQLKTGEDNSKKSSKVDSKNQLRKEK